MTEEIPNPFFETFSKLNTILLRCKDCLSDNKSFELKTFRKNMVTKVYCEGSIYSKPIVFLLAVSFFDTKRMIEVVKAGLESSHKIVTTSIEVEEQNVEKIREFIRSSNSISVEYYNNWIFFKSNDEYINIFKIEEIDESAIYFLVRSLCVFLAICGKNVTNNIDCVKLNDYGCIES